MRLSAPFLLAQAFIAIIGVALGSDSPLHIHCDCNITASNPCICYGAGSSSSDQVTDNNPEFTGSDYSIWVGGDTTRNIYLHCPDGAKASSAKITNVGKFSCDKSTYNTNEMKIHCDSWPYTSGHHIHLQSYTCSTYTVVGYWKEQDQIIGETEYTYERGTDKTKTETTTNTWTTSVTNTVDAGLEADGGSVTDTLSATVSHEVAQTDSQFWETSTLTEWTTTFPASEAGKVIWQWMYNITDKDLNTVMTQTTYLAKTSNSDERPKCVGGHADDKGSYQTCVSGYYLPGYDSTSRARRFLRG